MASCTNGSVTHTQHRVFALCFFLSFNLVYDKYNDRNESAARRVSVAGRVAVVVVAVKWRRFAVVRAF